MDAKPEIDLARIRATVAQSGFDLGQTAFRIWWFGNTPELAGKLGELVRAGQKRASAGSLWSWEAEGEALPEAGEIHIVIDWAGSPLAVIEITEVEVRAFKDVDESFAREEGEGDRTLEWWRKAHWEYFSRECPAIGRQPTEDMPLVCTKFRLLHAVRTAPGLA